MLRKEVKGLLETTKIDDNMKNRLKQLIEEPILLRELRGPLRCKGKHINMVRIVSEPDFSQKKQAKRDDSLINNI
jgi:hypothetical protein